MIYLDISHLRISDYSSLKKKLANIQKARVPPFEDNKENIHDLKKIMKKYRMYKNLILIGNGGSNTSFKAFHEALVPLHSRKKAFILTTVEPDLIYELKKRYRIWNTLVMPISKSGTTIGCLEAMFSFSAYRIIPVTGRSGALSIIAKEERMPIIPHPDIGGRFAGFTSCGLAPALFFGIDVEEIVKGAHNMYRSCTPTVTIDRNPALQLAASLYILEKKGYNEIFCPIYSSKLTGFKNLIVQLMHESVCKSGKGQTVFCAEAPEFQHHTNQRIFGGKKNVIGCFITVETQKENSKKVRIPSFAKDIAIRTGKLSDIDNVPLAKALNFEFKGSFQAAVEAKIPSCHVELDKITPFTVGEFLAFWHYVAVYSALLRDVNPYDQPQVEKSKEISFRLRQQYRE